jgi:hypothetical protein
MEPLWPCDWQPDWLSRWPNGHRQRRAHAQLSSHSCPVHLATSVQECCSHDGRHQRASSECYRRRAYAIFVRDLSSSPRSLPLTDDKYVSYYQAYNMIREIAGTGAGNGLSLSTMICLLSFAYTLVYFQDP